jgi:hypothetical protein
MAENALRRILWRCLAVIMAMHACTALAEAPSRDPYAYCTLSGSTSLRVDGGFGADWTVPERPVAEYPDGSTEGIAAANVHADGGALHLTAHQTSDSMLGNPLMHSNYLRNIIIRNDTLRRNLTAKFSSGRVMSRKPVHFGCIEFVAQLPVGRGFWPALWLRTPYGQPIDGEIDVVEGFGGHPGVFQSTLHHWHNGVQPTSAHPRMIGGVDRSLTCARVVAANPQPAAATQQAIRQARWAGIDKWHLDNWQFASAETPCALANVSPALDFSRGFHRYLIVWTPDRLIWALDGKPYFETTDDIPKQPMVVVMNLSVGKMDGYPDPTTPKLGDFQIRSVRLLPLKR